MAEILDSIIVKSPYLSIQIWSCTFLYFSAGIIQRWQLNWNKQLHIKSIFLKLKEIWNIAQYQYYAESKLTLHNRIDYIPVLTTPILKSCQPFSTQMSCNNWINLSVSEASSFFWTKFMQSVFFIHLSIQRQEERKNWDHYGKIRWQREELCEAKYTYQESLLHLWNLCERDFKQQPISHAIG